MQRRRIHRAVPLLIATALGACGDEASTSTHDVSAISDIGGEADLPPSPDGATAEDTQGVDSSDDTSAGDVSTDDVGPADTQVDDATPGPDGTAPTDTMDDTGPSVAWPYTNAYFAAGARLTPVTARDAHGNQALTWFQDNTLDTPCAVRRASDGELRCLPPTTALKRNLQNLTVGANRYFSWVYADDTCTTIAWDLPNGCLGNARWFEADGRIFARSDDAAAPSLHINVTGTCEAYSPGAYPTFVTEAMLTAVDPATFVAFAAEGVDVADGAGVELLRGDDGSLMPRGLWHVETNSPARVHPLGRLVPYAHTLFFLDGAVPSNWVRPDCTTTTVAAYIDTDPGFTPAFVEAIGRDAAGEQVSRFLPITSVQDGYCTSRNESFTAEPGYRVYVVDANDVSALDAFPEAAIRWDEAASGVAFSHAYSAGGAALLPLGVGYGEDGNFTVRLNGLVRSVGARESAVVALPGDFRPWSGYIHGYADSNCENAVYASRNAPGGGSVAPSGGSVFFEPGLDGCSSLSGGVPFIGDAWASTPSSPWSTNAALFARTGEACTAQGSAQTWGLSRPDTDPVEPLP